MMKKDFGWQDLWKTAVAKSGINVKRNTRVEIVKYLNERKSIAITARSMLDGNTETLEFDFCIFAIPDPLQVMQNPTKSQKEILSRFNNYRPTVTSIIKVDSRNWPHECGFVLDKDGEYNLKGSQVEMTAVYRQEREVICSL